MTRGVHHSVEPEHGISHIHQEFIIDYYKSLRWHAGGNRSPAIPSSQSQQLDRRLPDQPQSDSIAWDPPRAASPPISLRSYISEQTSLSNWARDHSMSAHPRPSRASSIVSTKTKTSINTFQEDTRSIDIVLGAQSFRINRDGSKIISSKDDLPPYTPPTSNTNNLCSNPEHPFGQLDDTTPPRTPRGLNRDSQRDDTHGAYESGESSTPIGASRGFFNERDPLRVPTPTNAEDCVQLTPPMHSAELWRHTEGEATPVKLKGRRTWQSLPVKPGLGGSSLGKNRRSVSQSDMRGASQLMDGTEDSIPWLRRRASVQLPKFITNESDGKLQRSQGLWDAPVHEPLVEPISRPMAPTPGRVNYRCPIFSTFSGLNPQKITASSSPRSFATVSKLSLSSLGRRGHLAVPESPAFVEEGDAESNAPPPMESDNDISIHYTRLIRSIDRDHRRALHQRDKELASMRERLNEVDQVYRKELKSRDFTIDDLRTRLEAQEDRMETRIEKAQNEVEDLWEKRWKDRDRHLMERMRRIELDSQRCVERAVAERDEEWGAEWARKNEQLLGRLKFAENAVMEGLPP